MHSKAQKCVISKAFVPRALPRNLYTQELRCYIFQGNCPPETENSIFSKEFVHLSARRFARAQNATFSRERVPPRAQTLHFPGNLCLQEPKKPSREFVHPRAQNTIILRECVPSRACSPPQGQIAPGVGGSFSPFNPCWYAKPTCTRAGAHINTKVSKSGRGAKTAVSAVLRERPVLLRADLWLHSCQSRPPKLWKFKAKRGENPVTAANSEIQIRTY